MYPFRYLPSGHIFLNPFDNCKKAAEALEDTGYKEDFCLAMDFDPWFIAELMAAGFLVMSCETGEPDAAIDKKFILDPRHHLIRSCLFFPELHIKKSIAHLLPLYEICFNRDFDFIFDRCITAHGEDWLTPPLVSIIRVIRNSPGMPVKPVSFALYREGKLVAGEIGIVSGKVYTSYTGYYDEDNAGTIQMIKSSQYLEKNGYAFWDLGMPLDYKLTLGARDISRGEFLELFFKAQG